MRRRKPIPEDYSLPNSFDFAAFDQIESLWKKRSDHYRAYLFLLLLVITNVLGSITYLIVKDNAALTFGNLISTIPLSFGITILSIYPFYAIFAFSDWLYSNWLSKRLLPNYLRITSGLVIDYRKDLDDWNYLNLETGQGFWKVLRGAAFEDALAILFQRRGVSVEKTKATGDGGIDLVLRSGSDLIFVQCKGYAKPVPVSAIREIAGVCSRSHAIPVVAAVNGFTKGAIECARELNVTLVDTPGIVRMAALDYLDKSILQTAARYK
jgi:restriction system protein